MLTRGAFIVIEGLDRSGKSTQAAVLKERLAGEGVQVELMKFPDRTTSIGQMIDAYLRSSIELDDHVVHLLYSANRWELATRILDLLASGTTVVCDRYAFSGIAFSASKIKTSNRVLPYAWCRAPDAGLPAPDVTLFFDIAPSAARARGGYGEERYEREDMQGRVMQAYARLGAEMEAERPGSWVRVDAGQSVENVTKEVWDLVSPLTRGIEGEVGKLWVGE
ncbi:thymidylate kinase-domain-containing protein [Schizophyllum amplum]|uniref:Thymidylate kinase n=1 Tax=Schizophyllum amplum TaxID=97359 RepID=A0A550C7S9_9AGAR|nr:thymidylate kinase-domain-containing protein [Auriculariopsis ampla]